MHNMEALKNNKSSQQGGAKAQQPTRRQPRTLETHNKEITKNTRMPNKEKLKNTKSAQQGNDEKQQECTQGD